MGEPERLVSPLGSVLIWIDRGAKIRLTAQVIKADGKDSHCNLFLQPYTPLSALIGHEPGIFSVLKTHQRRRQERRLCALCWEHFRANLGKRGKDGQYCGLRTAGGTVGELWRSVDAFSVGISAPAATTQNA